MAMAARRVPHTTSDRHAHPGAIGLHDLLRDGHGGAATVAGPVKDERPLPAIADRRCEREHHASARGRARRNIVRRQLVKIGEQATIGDHTAHGCGDHGPERHDHCADKPREDARARCRSTWHVLRVLHVRGAVRRAGCHHRVHAK